MAVDVDGPIELGPYKVNFATARISRDGSELDLRPQAFRALRVLLQNPGRLVNHAQMIREAWDGIQVSRHTVAVTVGEVKNVLQECGSWISVRSKLGYCLEIPESEDLLLTGLHFRNQYNRRGFENALHRFQRAAQKDSADFRVLEAMSGTYLLLGAFLLHHPHELRRNFLDAHERAVALRGSTLELFLDRAYARYIFEGNVSLSESELLQVRAHRPKSADAYSRLAMVYLGCGRVDEALTLMEQARASDLLMPPIAFVEVIVRLFRREFDQAVERGEEAMDLHPASPFGRIFYAEALEHSGRHEEAMRHYRIAAASAADAPWVRAEYARFLAKVGCTDEATGILDALLRTRESDFVDAYHLALLLDALGKRDEAFLELDRAYNECSYMLLLIDGDPKADPIRGDPRFSLLRSRVLQRAHQN